MKAHGSLYGARNLDDGKTVARRPLTQELVRDNADAIKEGPGPKFTRKQIFVMFREDFPWMYGLFILGLFLLFVFAALLGGTFRFATTALYYLYSSIFTGLSALVALIFTFAIFAYRRGEDKGSSLSKEAENRVARVFRDVELFDELEGRTWLWLWEKANTVKHYDHEDWRRYDAAKRALGQYIHETEVLNSLIIRTLAVVSSFVLVIVVSLLLLGFGVEYGTSSDNSTSAGAGPISINPVYHQLVPIAIILSATFSIMWFLRFVFSVFISINRKKSDFFTAKAGFTQAELDACLPDIRNADVEEIDSLLVRFHM